MRTKPPQANWIRQSTMMKRAHHFDLTQCSDPACGPHIIAYDDDSKPICEIVVARAMVPTIIAAMQAMLYRKVTEE
jgi:hypothetical protein